MLAFPTLAGNSFILFFPGQVFLFTYFPQSSLIFEHIQWEMFPTQRFSASHTWYVLKPPGSVSQGSPLSLGGTSHQVPQHRPCCPDSEWEVFLQRCPVCPCCWRPGFQIQASWRRKLALLCYPWISFFPKTQSFSSFQQERVPLRTAVICSVLENRKACQIPFFQKHLSLSKVRE